MIPTVQLLTTCQNCTGEAYLPIGEFESCSGETYTRYAACPHCQGSGSQTQWISLRELAELLEQAVSLEPNWKELAQQKFATQYADSCDAAGI